MITIYNELDTFPTWLAKKLNSEASYMRTNVINPPNTGVEVIIYLCFIFCFFINSPICVSTVFSGHLPHVVGEELDD